MPLYAMPLRRTAASAEQALEKASLSMDEIDLIEVNEAFSSIPLAWARAMTGGDLSRVNVNGGAIARGHPMGATGGMLMANLVGELERRGKRYGLLTMCESGGTANATIVERVVGPSPAYPLASPPVGRPAPAPAGGSCLLTMGRGAASCRLVEGRPAGDHHTGGWAAHAHHELPRARESLQPPRARLRVARRRAESVRDDLPPEWGRDAGLELRDLEAGREPQQRERLHVPAK